MFSSSSNKSLLSSLLLFGINYANAQNTYCYDNSECSGDSITGSSSFCYGYNGCSTSVFDISSSAYCYGYRSCYRAEIEAESNVLCYGLDGCYNAEIETDASVYCNGRYGCYLADVTVSDRIYAYGDQGAIYSTIADPSYVYGYGYYALRYSDIIVTSGVSTSVYSYGYFSTYASAVWCFDGSTCNVYCRASGCYDINIYCYDGATCSTSCVGSNCDYDAEIIEIGSSVTASYASFNEYKESKFLIKNDMRSQLHDELTLFKKLGKTIETDSNEWNEIQNKYEMETNEKIKLLNKKYSINTKEEPINLVDSDNVEVADEANEANLAHSNSVVIDNVNNNDNTNVDHSNNNKHIVFTQSQLITLVSFVAIIAICVGIVAAKCYEKSQYKTIS